jgi:hypothetical protein
MHKGTCAIIRGSLLVALSTIAGCTHFGIDDCPTGAVLGEDIPRVRSSHYRMALANLPAAAARFLPYAVMSAYAYRDGPDCNPGGENPVSDDKAAKLAELLNKTTGAGSPWKRGPAHLEPAGNCEDERGMMYNVWHRQVDGRIEVVIAFRGTSTTNDWWYGNLWWFTRYIFTDNQITRARDRGRIIIDYFKKEAQAADEQVRFYTTGHSLGGSLAQHVLYAYSREVMQAIVFDPSGVTGFDDLSLDQQLEGCSCGEVPAPETRMMRVYESGEILSNLRIFHKIWFAPHRHIQEIRLPLIKSSNPIAGHGIAAFAEKLAEATSGTFVSDPKAAWYASSDAQCTARFIEGQQASCRIKATSDEKCPQ